MKKVAILLFLTLAIGLSAIVNIGDEYIGSTPMGMFRKTAQGSSLHMTTTQTNYYYDEDIPTRLTKVEHTYSCPEEHEHMHKKWLYQYLEFDDHREMIVSYYVDSWDPESWSYSGYEHMYETTYNYDLQDKLLEYISVYVPNGNADRTAYEYDDRGNLIQESLYRNWDSETVPTRVTTYAYDAQNRMIHKLLVDYGQRLSEIRQRWSNHSLPDSTYTWWEGSEKVQYNFFDENGQRHHTQVWSKQPRDTFWWRSDSSFIYVTAHQIHFPIQIFSIRGRSYTPGGPFYAEDSSTVVNYTYSNDYRTVSVTPSDNEIYYYNDDWLLIRHEKEYPDYDYHYYNTWEYYGSTPNDDPTAIPPALVSAYPNPAKGMVNISLSKRDAPNPVEAKVYNIKGQLVRNLQVNDLSSDQYHYNWDCKDFHSRDVPAGVYLIRIKTERGEVSKKVTILK